MRRGVGVTWAPCGFWGGCRCGLELCCDISSHPVSVGLMPCMTHGLSSDCCLKSVSPRTVDMPDTQIRYFFGFA